MASMAATGARNLEKALQEAYDTQCKKNEPPERTEELMVEDMEIALEQEESKSSVKTVPPLYTLQQFQSGASSQSTCTASY